MITAHYDRAGCRLTLKGHGGGTPGRDIVCAAASILAFTLAANLEELERRGEARGVRVYLRPGYAAFAAQPEPAPRAALDFTATGLKLLAKKYGERVKVREASLERGRWHGEAVTQGVLGRHFGKDGVSVTPSVSPFGLTAPSGREPTL